MNKRLFDTALLSQTTGTIVDHMFDASKFDSVAACGPMRERRAKHFDWAAALACSSWLCDMTSRVPANNRKNIMYALRIVVLVCAIAVSLRAQATLGSAAVGGTVTDPSGAAIPDARVVLLETARGLSRETASNSAGSYLFPSVSPGVYALRVTKDAFDAYELKGAQVAVGDLATLDVVLKVGQVSTVLSVSAEKTVLLETESNTIGTVVDSGRVESLPLNGRNFLQLALTAAGSEPVSGRSDNTGQVGHPDRSVIIAGNIGSSTGYSINGIATRGGRLGESALNLSIAAIDQFKVQQSFFMPDQGPDPGLVNVTTRGGNNEFHGQAFEFVRNGDFDARNFFAIAPENLKRNQFGGAVGGPIRKNRIWFYANYEGLRQITGFTASAYTPTAALFAGDFRLAGQVIYDPATFSPETGKRQPFPNNIIPSDRINPVAKNLLKYYLPGSSIAQRPANLFANPRNTLDDDQFGVRIDASLTDRQTIFGQILRENSPAETPGIFPLSGASYPNGAKLAMMQHTWTIRPVLINTFRFGILRNEALQANQARDLGNLSNAIGIPNTEDGRGVSGVTLQGFAAFGHATGDIGNIDNNYQLDEGMNYVRGTHNYQFGAGIRYIRTWQENATAGANGTLAFQAQFTAQLAANPQGQLSPQAGTGNSFADFLLGTPTNSSTGGLPMIPYRFTQFLPYFADTWKVTRNLTLNYGVSWFLATIPDPQGIYRKWPHGFDYKTGLLTFAALGQIDPKVIPTPLNQFTPRFGLAWKPGFLPDTVIRSGVGVYYSDGSEIELQAAMVAPPFSTPVALVNGPFTPLPTYQLGRNIFPAASFPPLDASFAASLPKGTAAFLIDPSFKAPYVTQWNFSIQHSFSTGDVAEVVYLGSSGHRQLERYDPSACIPALPDLRCNPATSPYPRYSQLLTAGSSGNSSYEALIGKYRRRVAGGLNFNAEYTFSKALLDGSERAGLLDSQIATCRRCDKGPAAFNQAHRMVLSSVYELPVGRGKRFGATIPRAADIAVGGWILTGISTFATGTPIPITAPNTTGVQSATVRPNRLCNGMDSHLSGNLRGNGFIDFNTSCFVSPPVGYFGNSGRDPITGPGVQNWDVGLQKTFPLPFRERTKLKFRGEFFNVFNHANFNLPNSNAGDTVNFGRISSARTPRLIQLGLKLLF